MPSNTLDSLSELIRDRRAIYPKSYVPGLPVERDLLERLLENANWAPTHRRTEPWRFQVFHSEESRLRLGEMLSDFFRKNTPEAEFSEEKMRKSGENPVRSAAVIAIILRRDPEQKVPEWEEVAAVAMAVQNLWLSCSAAGLGSYWSTPRAALEANEFFGLEAGERCLGLFYIGRHELPEIPGKRGDIAEKTTWK